MKKSFLAAGIASLLMMSGSAAAQERSAGQSYDAQVNWSVMSNKMDAINSQNQAIAASLTALQTSINTINTKLAAIAACGAQKKVWTGSACVAATVPTLPAPTCSLVSVGAPSGWPTPACPAGSTKVVTGASAAYSTSGHGSSNSGSTFSGVNSTTACMKIVCQ